MFSLVTVVLAHAVFPADERTAETRPGIKTYLDIKGMRPQGGPSMGPRPRTRMHELECSKRVQAINRKREIN